MDHMTKTKYLIKSLECQQCDIPDNITSKLGILAKENKVLLEFLRKTKTNTNALRIEENRYKQFVNDVHKVTHAIRDLKYALYKFRRPIDHVSVDIDILIDIKDLPKAYSRLKTLGFDIEVLEPYTLTLKGKNGRIIDLYTHPAFGWIIYLNGQKLLQEETECFEWEGQQVMGLTKEAEAVMASAHAIYKEQIYLLIDYLTINKWGFNKKAFSIARRYKVYDAHVISIYLNNLIEMGLIETPYKLPAAKSLMLGLKKFKIDPNYRETSLNIIKYIIQRKAGYDIYLKLKRKTY